MTQISNKGSFHALGRIRIDPDINAKMATASTPAADTSSDGLGFECSFAILSIPVFRSSAPITHPQQRTTKANSTGESL
jgi:hypothetical protein